MAELADNVPPARIVAGAPTVDNIFSRPGNWIGFNLVQFPVLNQVFITQHRVVYLEFPPIKFSSRLINTLFMKVASRDDSHLKTL